MKAGYFLFAAAALLIAACSKETEQEQSSLSFGLNVRNEDYTESISLKGVGKAQIVSADNLPQWIVYVANDEKNQGDDPIAIVSIKGDNDLEDSRTAKIVLTMSNGKSVNLELTQWPIIKDATNAAYKSANIAFEKDWSTTMDITLITGNEIVNGRQEVTKRIVSLPWDWDHSPICFLPKGDGRDETNEVYKMLQNKADWSLVFNLTGINALPGRHYFGLYNRYTGVLRIFYYMTQDLIPENANDHMWSFSLNASLAEHVATQFALPRQEEATRNYLARASLPVLSSPNTDAYNPLSGQTRNTLAEGWWAFDVNMAAYRNHNFFNENPRSAASIQLCTYSDQQVFLNSVLKGNLNGSMKGSINLDLIRPSSVHWAAKLTSQIVAGGGTIISNNFFLNEVCKGKYQASGSGTNNTGSNKNQIIDRQDDDLLENALKARSNAPLASSFDPQTKSMVGACASLIVGVVLSVGAKWIESLGTKKVESSDFGALQATMSMDLNAIMATQGTIGAPTPNKVPPVTMSMDYFKKKNQDENGTLTCMGEGIWNLENHPVIYIVKDAYWNEAKFTVLSKQREYQVGGDGKYSEDVYSYDIGATKGSRPGLRLITFLDPTSITGVALNPNLFNEKLEQVNVYLSYGVYPGSTPGYTDAFRRDLDLDYPHTWPLGVTLSEDGKKYLTDNIKMVRKVHTDPLFKWTTVPDDLRSIVGYRLSTQKIDAAKYPGMERRFFGQSSYFKNPYATDYIVDEAQFVYDPQVYVPFDDAGHRLYDPQVPDFVVTAMINAYGKDKKDTEDAALTNTLRFIPKIELVSYKELPDILAKIKSQRDNMSGPQMKAVFVEMNSQIDHIEEIVKATAELRN